MSAPALVAPVLALPEYKRTIPKSARQWATDPTTIKIRSWTVGQEMDAQAAADAGGTRLEFEIFQRCVIEVDGQPVDQGSPDIATRCSPRVRMFLMRMVNKIVMPTEEENRLFDESEEVSVP